MEEWTAYFTNNPDDDYNLIVEILYKEEDVALISNGKDGLEIKWYATEKDIIIPFDWFMDLLNDAKKRLMTQQPPL